MFSPGEMSVMAAGAAGLCAVGIGAYGMFSPRSGLMGPVVWRGAGSGEVALTFDDGPWPGSTDRILDTLKRERIFAVFFVIGRHVRDCPALVQRMHEEGHIIGNHSFDHDRTGMFRWGGYWREQIERTDDAVEQTIGVRPALFRPPMGYKSPHLMGAARAAGHTVVTWSQRGRDGVQTRPEVIIRNATRARGGDIVLLHDGRDPASGREVGATAEALPAIIASLRARGLEFARLDAMTKLRAYRGSGSGARAGGIAPKRPAA